MATIKERVNSILSEFKVNLKAEEIKFAEASLEDGTMIYTDSETWDAGVNELGPDQEHKSHPSQ